MLFLSLVPLVLFVILVFSKKIKLIWTSLISLLITLFLVVFVWQMQPNFIGASFLKGTFVATDILLIIFGALFFLETLKRTKIIDNLCLYLEKISPDYRLQIILLAWFLENFLEGTAGFGTPATVVTPLLIGIGLSPISAVSVAMLGNSTAGAFGAAGTPIRVGFAGLNLTNVPLYASLFNLVGLIVPIFILWFSTFGQKDRKTHFFEALPFAIFSGIAFIVPSVFLTFLGQEFPSIIGSVIGLLIVLIAIKFKIFIPRQTRTLRQESLKTEKISPLKVFFPYLLFIFLLIVGKFCFSHLNFTLNFGLKHTFTLFNPGLIFILATIPTIILYEKSRKNNFKTIKESFIKAIEPFLVIATISIMVQLMIYSNQNISGNYSILQIIANNFKTPFLPFIAPIVGAFGSFLTGSVTISNIMFGGIFQNISLAMGFNTAMILSLQLVGGAAGNMVALADILPALTVVGLKGQEREVIKRIIIPCLIYILIVGFLGFVLIR